MPVANCTDTNCLVGILTPFAVVALFLLAGVVAIAWPINKEALEADCEKRQHEEEEFERLKKLEFKRRTAHDHPATWEAEGPQLQSMSVMSPITGNSDQPSMPKDLRSPQ